MLAEPERGGDRVCREGLTAPAARAPIAGREGASIMPPKRSGLKVGGVVITPTVPRSTSGAHDTPLSQDRDRRKDEDQHVAEHGEGAPMPGREAPEELTAGEQ